MGRRLTTRADGRERPRPRRVAAALRCRHAMYRRRALIIGIAGQDGSLLAELLLAEGYEVFGVVRQPVSSRFENLVGDSRADRADAGRRARRALARRRADDAAGRTRSTTSRRPSFVPMSWRQPVLTAEFAAVGCTALLEAIRRVDDGDPLLPGVLERDLRRAAARCRRPRRRRSRRSRRTASPRRTRTSSRSATGAATGCTPRPGSSTTTSRRDGRSTS